MTRVDLRFELAEVDEPVARYLSHALSDGATVPEAVTLQMSGRINPSIPLRFTASQRFAGHAFDRRVVRRPPRAGPPLDRELGSNAPWRIATPE